jgi:hypothetical protein
MTALAGAEVSFAHAGRLLSGLAGVTISARTIERSAEAIGAAARAEAAAILTRQITVLPRPAPMPGMLYVEADGTVVPMRASETEGRAGKDSDGRAGTREVKLARLFTVPRLDKDGRPVTDRDSSTYVATSPARTPRRAGGSRVPTSRGRALPPSRRPRRRRGLDLDHQDCVEVDTGSWTLHAHIRAYIVQVCVCF